jgi:hypothetical protein
VSPGRTEELILIFFGRHLLAGAVAFERYGHLLLDDTTFIPPFLRATDASRVMHSAGNWTAGFLDASPSKIEISPPLIYPRSSEVRL